MKHKLGKFFWKYKNENRMLNVFDYEPANNRDYYEYVKHYHQLGFHQLILTSDLIIDLVSYYFLEKHMSIGEIEFMEEDESLDEKIQNLIENCRIDRGYFTELIKELNFICEETSIDIKRIVLINQFDFNMLPKSIFFQVNGIIGIDEKSYENEIQSLIVNLQR